LLRHWQFAGLLPAAGRISAQDLIPTQNPTGRPEVLRDVGFDQKLNNQSAARF